MGMNHRGDDLRALLARTDRDATAMADARATIEEFNARLAAGREAWFWPTIAAALASRHHWPRSRNPSTGIFLLVATLSLCICPTKAFAESVIVEPDRLYAK